jgi:hypothetical protein
MAVRTSRSDWASESVFTEDLDGAGITGGSIGVAGTRCITTAGTTRGAIPFITGAVTTGEAASGALQGTCSAALRVSAAGLVAAQTPGTDLPTEILLGAAVQTTVRARQPGLSTETAKPHEDTLARGARLGRAPAPSAGTTGADRQGAIRRAEVPAWQVAVRAAEGHLTAAVAAAGITKRRSVVWQGSVCSRPALKFRIGEKRYAADKGKIRQIAVG